MKRRGFTLIELLVVIAIIAILAAILFPVFAQAREKARQITCVSNMKQISLAILMYQQDYDEYFPIAWTNTGPVAGGTGTNWSMNIEPYIKSGSGAPAGYWAGVEWGGVWACPDYPPNGSVSVPWFQYMAFSDVIDDSATSGGAPARPVPDSEINLPSQKVMLYESRDNANCGGWPGSSDGTDEQDIQTETDWATLGQNPPGNIANVADEYPNDLTSGNGWAGGTPNTCWSYPSEIYPAYRHAKHSNFAFTDGHVKAIALGQLSYVNNVYNYPSTHDTHKPQ